MGTGIGKRLSYVDMAVLFERVHVDFWGAAQFLFWIFSSHMVQFAQKPAAPSVAWIAETAVRVKSEIALVCALVEKNCTMHEDSAGL